MSRYDHRAPTAAPRAMRPEPDVDLVEDPALDGDAAPLPEPPAPEPAPATDEQPSWWGDFASAFGRNCYQSALSIGDGAAHLAHAVSFGQIGTAWTDNDEAAAQFQYHPSQQGGSTGRLVYDGGMLTAAVATTVASGGLAAEIAGAGTTLGGASVTVAGRVAAAVEQGDYSTDQAVHDLLAVSVGNLAATAGAGTGMALGGGGRAELAGSVVGNLIQEAGTQVIDGATELDGGRLSAAAVGGVADAAMGGLAEAGGMSGELADAAAAAGGNLVAGSVSDAHLADQTDRP